MNGVVFGIDGEQFPSGFSGGSHDEFAGGYEDFFVRESHGASKFYGFVGGFEADDPDGGGEDDFSGGVGSNREHAFGAVVDVRKWSFSAETRGEVVGELRRCDGNDLGVVAFDLGEEFIEIVAGGQGDDFELIGEGFDDG